MQTEIQNLIDNPEAIRETLNTAQLDGLIRKVTAVWGQTITMRYRVSEGRSEARFDAESEQDLVASSGIFAKVLTKCRIDTFNSCLTYDPSAFFVKTDRVTTDGRFRFSSANLQQGFFMRADLDGFTKKVQDAFDSGSEQTIHSLLMDFTNVLAFPVKGNHVFTLKLHSEHHKIRVTIFTRTTVFFHSTFYSELFQGKPVLKVNLRQRFLSDAITRLEPSNRHCHTPPTRNPNWHFHSFTGCLAPIQVVPFSRRTAIHQLIHRHLFRSGITHHSSHQIRLR